MWQYTSRGNVDGISGHVDLDIAYKDYPSIIIRKGFNGFKADAQVLKDKQVANNTQDKTTRDATTSGADYRVHIVVKGDTLWDIARAYLGGGLKYKDIMRLNGLSSTIIYPGQRLKIPSRK